MTYQRALRSTSGNSVLDQAEREGKRSARRSSGCQTCYRIVIGLCTIVSIDTVALKLGASLSEPIVTAGFITTLGFTIQKFFSSYNIPKVTASTTRQVLISDRTVTFSESSSLRSKRACNILQKCPPTQKIGITCFL